MTRIGSTRWTSRIVLYLFVVLTLTSVGMVCQYPGAATLAASRVDAQNPNVVTWYVSPTGDDLNSCLSAVSPCETIVGALNKASSGDRILVTAGVYSTPGTCCDVIANNTGVDYFLSGGWDATFSVQNGMSVVDGLGVLRPLHHYNAGTIDHFVFRDGIDTAIWNEGNHLSLRDCVVSNNSHGAGIVNDGVLTLKSSTVSDNIGIEASLGSGSAGGINNQGILTLNNSTVSRNVGEFGGGIWNSTDGVIFLNNSTISGNTAIKGGGVFLDSGILSLQNSVVADNAAAEAGPDCHGAMVSDGHNIVGNTAGCTFLPGAGDLTNLDPKLQPLSDNGGPTHTHALSPDSPAVDAGGGCVDGQGSPLLFDQRGFPRLGPCDIGAYELQPPIGHVGDVLVRGPSQVSLGTASTFTGTVVLANAMQPITFIWTATGQPPQTHTVSSLRDSASFTWNVSGSKTVTATVTNAVSGATAMHQVFVGIPPTSVILSGTTDGHIGISFPFTATVTPDAATLPITFIWQATGQQSVLHLVDGLTDTVPFTWNNSGNKTIVVTVSNEAGSVSGSANVLMRNTTVSLPDVQQD